MSVCASRKRQVDGKYIRLQHPHFRRGQLQLLQLIKRKSTHDTHSNVRQTVASLTAQVKELKGQYDDLFKIQQQILYIFSRYMRANPIPRTLAGGRERLMLGGEDKDGGGGNGLLPHPNVELVEDDDDEEAAEELQRGVEHGRDDDEGPADDRTAAALIRLEDGGDGDVEAFDEGVGFDDDEEGVDEDEESKEASEATAQAFAELQNLQDIIDQMPGKQEFLSSIPPIPSPSEQPSKRRARATSSSPAPPTPTAAAAAPKYESHALYEPTSPPAAMSTFNAFPATDASVALPPLYPSQSYLNAQAATAAAASTTPASTSNTAASRASKPRSKPPKLLYSEEHYAALDTRDAQQQQQQQHAQQPSDDDSKLSLSQQQQLPLVGPALYGNNSFSSWSAQSEQKENEPLSGSLFTPANIRANSWMPSDIPPQPGSPQLASYLNADDGAGGAEYSMALPSLSGELSEHAANQAAMNGGAGLYSAWQQYQY